MLTRHQIEAMDETMTADTGHHAQAFARTHLRLLEDQCGVVDDPLAAAITRRERILAQNPMPGWVRKSLERRNENSVQVMKTRAAQDADDPANPLSRALFWIGIAILACVGVWHLVAANWRL